MTQQGHVRLQQVRWQSRQNGFTGIIVLLHSITDRFVPLNSSIVPFHSAGKLISEYVVCIMPIVKLIAYEKQRDAMKLEKPC